MTSDGNEGLQWDREAGDRSPWLPADQAQPGQPGQPQYGQAQYGQAQHGQAQYGQAQYGQAQYGQAQYGQAQYGQAQYGQAQYGQPHYAQPQYGQSQWGPPPGAQPYGQQGWGQPGYGGWSPYAPAPRTNGMAVASLVLSLVWLWWLGSILALVFGYIAKAQIRRTGEGGSGLATAGIVLGWIGVAILALIIGLGVSGAFDEPDDRYLPSPDGPQLSLQARVS